MMTSLRNLKCSISRKNVVKFVDKASIKWVISPGSRFDFSRSQYSSTLDSPSSVRRLFKSRADHLFLFFAQMDAALVVNQLPDKFKIRVADLHKGRKVS